MATYAQEYDTALLQAPWLSKTDSSSKPYLIKYARHPSKPGFIALVTDLTKVWFEPLVGIRLLARQREVEEKYGESQRTKDAGGSSLDMGGEDAVNEVLRVLDALMGDEWLQAEVTVSAGDLYDLDVVLKSSHTHWLFHMTEIRYGCLEVITRHILHPLALSVTSSRRPANSTDEQIVEVVSSELVLSAINSHSSIPAKPEKPTESETDYKAERPTKSRLVRRRDPNTSKAGSATPEPKASSPGRTASHARSPSPTLRDTTPAKPRSKKQKSPSPLAEEDEMMPEEDESPLPTPPLKRKSPSPPQRTHKGKRKSNQEEASDDEVDDDEEKTSNAASPEPPHLPPPSQKTQKEKDEEEEAELAKKRDEMKRKMGAGGGGRLVRRRFGR